MYKFKFSIVMAVYNVELFLAEAIESVLKQDIGFKDNVQLILVDDGSKDNSGKICDEFAAKFPNNIKVIHKDNGGVSSARNEGLKHIEGKYVNFLDSDDKLSEETLKNVFTFFENNNDVIDVVSVPIYFFDGQTGKHILNYKFAKGTRVIDLRDDYDCIQLSLSSAFIKYEAAKEINFDKRLQYAEDAKECVRMLLKKQTLGVVKEACYHYRKRTTGERSALQNSGLKKAWYMPSLNYFSYSSLNKAKELCGRVPLFVQYTLMYDLQWRFKTSLKLMQEVLNEQELNDFIKALYAILENFEDEIILKQRHITPEIKCFLLSKKYNMLPQIVADENDELAVTVNNTFVIEIKRCLVRLEFISIVDNTLEIEGTMTVIPTKTPTEIYLFVNGNIVPCLINSARNVHSECLGEVISEARTFKAKIDNLGSSKDWEIKICEKIGERLVEKESVRFGKFFPLTTAFRNSYTAITDCILTYDNNVLQISKRNIGTSILREVKLLGEFLYKPKAVCFKAVISRCLYHLVKPFLHKEIWLLSDRINKADDNGEALFKYLNEEKKPVDTYFVIRKDSPDFPVVSKMGKVLPYHSWKHKFYHLLADKTVSSAADDYVYNPFFGVEKYYHDILCKQKRIFLQHGITKDDLSDWLNRYNKDLSLFITSANPEYNSIIQGNYFYDASVVKLTGFTRFDRLENKAEKVITIMPTWRPYLLNESNEYSISGNDVYGDTFVKSQFRRFYNTLLNNKRVIECALKHGYKIKFMPHPRLIGAIKFFDKNNVVEFCDLNIRYRDIFNTSALLLTDYSSVAFDFAYLRKAIIYAQFDKEEFFAGAVYDKGYFDYERDGFGEVENDLESTVDRIIEYMENNCTLKDKYRERIDRFFAFNDRNNCQRVYEAIVNMK